MNILHYTGMPYSTKYGGFERWLVEFGKIANSMGHKTFISYTEKIASISTLNKDFEKNNITTIVTSNRNYEILLEQIKHYKIDIFITHFTEPYLEAEFIAKKTKCKVYSFFHCYNYYSTLTWKLNFKEKLAATYYRWLVFKSQFYIDKYFAVSKAVKKQFSNFCFLSSHKIDNIYLGTDKKTSLIDRKNTIPVLTCIACHGEDKGVDILIEAVKILKDRGLRFELWQVGGGMIFNNGKDTALLQSLVKENGIDDCFKWFGIRNDIDNILSHTDIYIQPSRREAISLTVAEAMMHSLPIVASNVDGIPEYIDHEITGLLYNNNNPTELANCIQYLIENSNTRRLLGENAYNKINSSTFDMTTNIQFFIDKYINKYV